MTALEALDGDFKAFAAFRSSILPVFEGGRYIQAAGAAHAELALFLGVQIDEDIALENAGLEAVGAGHAGFLVIGYKYFHGAMLYALVFQDGKAHGNSDTIICTKGGAVCGYPFAINICADGVREEVVGRIGGFLRNHVHVAL